MKIDVSIDPDDIQRKKADSRGRVTLGSDYADKEVLITVLDVEDPDRPEEVDMDAAAAAATEAKALIERADDPREVYAALQEGRTEEAYALMGLDPDDAAERVHQWRAAVVGEDEHADVEADDE